MTEDNNSERKEYLVNPKWKGLYNSGNMGYIASLSKDPDTFKNYWAYIVREVSIVINSELNRFVAQETQSNDSSDVETAQETQSNDSSDVETAKYFRVSGIKLSMPQDAVNNPNDITVKSYVEGTYTEFVAEE